MFERVCHADWSIDPRKRWTASARRSRDGWSAGRPVPVGSVEGWLEQAFAANAPGSLLLGLDLPIGLPRAYGQQTGLADFKSALQIFGREGWHAFFEVAETAAQISIRRPFYPARAVHGVSRSALIAGLGVRTFNDLLRDCDRRNQSGRTAASVLWTLGPNQVGKAAICGWQEVLLPALARGAALWPFDGDLRQLAHRHRVVLAETYPALALFEILGNLPYRTSKRRQADRQAHAAPILAWAERHRIDILPQARIGLHDGFGAISTGEDAFDAFVGLLGMIDAVESDRACDGPPGRSADPWEGWILGR